MKNFVFVFSLVSLLLGSTVSSEAAPGCFGKRKARRASRCVVSQPVRSCTPCVVQPVQACNPCVIRTVQVCNPSVATTQYADPYVSSGTAQGMTTYTSAGITPATWGTQPAMSQTYTAMKPRETNGSAEEWIEIKNQIILYIDSQNISICDLKSRFPEYGTIINELKLSGDKEDLICYPTQSAWMRRPEVRANIVRVLTNGGVLQPVAEPPAVKATPEAVAAPPEPLEIDGPLETVAPNGAAYSHREVLDKISSYLTANNLEICELKDTFPAYGNAILKLDPVEKYKKEGVLLCYPSSEAWEADTKGVKTEILAILAENGIL